MGHEKSLERLVTGCQEHRDSNGLNHSHCMGFSSAQAMRLRSGCGYHTGLKQQPVQRAKAPSSQRGQPLELGTGERV